MKQSIMCKIKRAVLYLLGFSATPMLTACYGMPYGYDEYIPDTTPFEDISGTVVDNKTDKPIKGIMVRVKDDNNSNVSAITNENGEFTIAETFGCSLFIQAVDIDGDENGSYFNSEREATSKNHRDIKFRLYSAEK